MADTGTALTTADDSAWKVACHRESVVRDLAELPKISQADVANASRNLGLSRTRIFELVALYRKDPLTSSLLGKPEGFPKGRGRLPDEVDQIIAAEIELFYLTRPKPNLAQLVRRVEYMCLERRLPAPTRKTVANRVAAINRNRLVQARDGEKAAADRFRPVTAHYSADVPLQIVQMDHTRADIIVVDEHFRKPLGRPILTLQIDIATRVIPGFYISLEAPSATSAGMAVRHAVLPKATWLEERAVELDYPVHGIPDVIHLDNAREFHSHAFTRGCQQHGIGIVYRPRRTPHYGGHIERLIGTMLGEVHLLPGTTFSNIQEKGDYDAEGHACMTLREFERWFTLQIGIYHGTIHSELGVPPLVAWKEAIGTNTVRLRLPADHRRFLLDFLPFEMRRVRREGIELFHAFYWHGALANLVANWDRKLPVKYHPLNLSAVFVELPDGGHLTVPLRDRRRPAITKFEHDRAIAALRERGRSAVDEEALFLMVGSQRQLVLDAIGKTKSARQSAQRVAYALQAGAPAGNLIATPALPYAPEADDTEPITPFQIEEHL